MSKTIKQIADEIGVSKQAVHQKRKKKPLSTSLQPFTTTVDGVVYISVDGENLIKQAFSEVLDRQSCKRECKPFTTTVDGLFTAPVDGVNVMKQGINENERKQDCKPFMTTVDGTFTPLVDREIEFLKGQIVHLQEELKKEREHNREKDKQLLDTLNKLAESQAALSAGQAADKQKALAEKIIDGQQQFNERKNNGFFRKLFKKNK